MQINAVPSRRETRAALKFYCLTRSGDEIEIPVPSRLVTRAAELLLKFCGGGKNKNKNKDSRGVLHYPCSFSSLGERALGSRQKP